MKQSDLADLTLSCYVYLSLHPQPSRIQLFKSVFTIIVNHIAPQQLPQCDEVDWHLPITLDVFHLVRCSVEEWFDGSAPPGLRLRASGGFKGWMTVREFLPPDSQYAAVHHWMTYLDGPCSVLSSMWAEVADVILTQAPPHFADLLIRMMNI